MGELVSDYTPKTEEVLNCYIDSVESHVEPTNREELAAEFHRWLAEYRKSVIDEVEDHLVRRDQFTERTLNVIGDLRAKA